VNKTSSSNDEISIKRIKWQAEKGVRCKTGLPTVRMGLFIVNEEC
jgi:hypothetical protein